VLRGLGPQQLLGFFGPARLQRGEGGAGLARVVARLERLPLPKESTSAPVCLYVGTGPLRPGPYELTVCGLDNAARTTTVRGEKILFTMPSQALPLLHAHPDVARLVRSARRGRVRASG